MLLYKIRITRLVMLSVLLIKFKFENLLKHIKKEETSCRNKRKRRLKGTM